MRKGCSDIDDRDHWMKVCLVWLLALCRGGQAIGATCDGATWPVPLSSSLGDASLAVGCTHASFFEQEGEGSALLTRAFVRFAHFCSLIPQASQASQASEASAGLSKMTIEVGQTEEHAPLQLDVNESYKLVISSTAAHLQAPTVWGVLHGLETFYQLLRSGNGGVIQIEVIPLLIQDSPRFKHRGIMIDSARHFLPTDSVKNLIDGMSMNKLNVLHWHLTDTQAFPVISEAYPHLSDGAYSTRERYSLAQLADIVDYAMDRGVRVVPELDVPGHVQSWGVGE
jgi:hexosaminidase